MMKKFGWYKHSEDGGGTSAPAAALHRQSRHSPPIERFNLVIHRVGLG